MNTDTNKTDHTTSEPSAPEDLTGAIWQGGTQGTEQAHFHWIDDESGERLEIRVEGDASFLTGLENLGFIRRKGASTGAPNAHRHETPRRSSERGGPHSGWQGRRGA